MRKIFLTTAAALGASLVMAAPAQANEARVEARGGVIWGVGDSEAIAGVAVGYDFDLGSSAFAGVEASGDKVLIDGTKVAFGASGRLGFKAGEATKVYATGGYTTEFADGVEGTWHAGAGVQQKLGNAFYIKAEYRHFFVENFDDADAVVGGVGVTF